MKDEVREAVLEILRSKIDAVNELPTTTPDNQQFKNELSTTLMNLLLLFN